MQEQQWGEKCLYLAADTIYCTEAGQTIRKYHPEAIILNCCEATTPLGPTYEMLREKKTCKQIIESASRPIEDLDNRLTLDGFQQWYKTS